MGSYIMGIIHIIRMRVNRKEYNVPHMGIKRVGKQKEFKKITFC